MDAERVLIVKRALAREKIDALLLRLPENLVMACGAWPLNGGGFALFTAADGPHTLIVPEGERGEVDSFWGQELHYFPVPLLEPFDPLEAVVQRLRDVLGSLGLTRGTIAYDEPAGYLAGQHNAGEVNVPTRDVIDRLAADVPSLRLVSGNRLIHELRACKTADEVERLRLAHRVAALGLERFAAVVEPGRSEAELGAAVYEAIVARGAELPGVYVINAFPQVSSGTDTARAWRPIVRTGPRRLARHDLAVLELAVCVNGYWADVTRVRAAGGATEVQTRAYDAVRDAQLAAMRTIRAGQPAGEVHAQATKVLIERGFGSSVVHFTGHGLGFSYHEATPMLRPGNAALLEAGQVCSVEPGLYNPAWGGIRLEDNVVVRESGYENLTPAPYALS